MRRATTRTSSHGSPRSAPTPPSPRGRRVPPSRRRPPSRARLEAAVEQLVRVDAPGKRRRWISRRESSKPSLNLSVYGARVRRTVATRGRAGASIALSGGSAQLAAASFTRARHRTSRANGARRLATTSAATTATTAPARSHARLVDVRAWRGGRAGPRGQVCGEVLGQAASSVASCASRSFRDPRQYDVDAMPRPLLDEPHRRELATCLYNAGAILPAFMFALGAASSERSVERVGSPRRGGESPPSPPVLRPSRSASGRALRRAAHRRGGWRPPMIARKRARRGDRDAAAARWCADGITSKPIAPASRVAVEPEDESSSADARARARMLTCAAAPRGPSCSWARAEDGRVEELRWRREPHARRPSPGRAPSGGRARRHRRTTLALAAGRAPTWKVMSTEMVNLRSGAMDARDLARAESRGTPRERAPARASPRRASRPRREHLRGIGAGGGRRRPARCTPRRRRPVRGIAGAAVARRGDPTGRGTGRSVMLAYAEARQHASAAMARATPSSACPSGRSPAAAAREHLHRVPIGRQRCDDPFDPHYNAPLGHAHDRPSLDESAGHACARSDEGSRRRRRRAVRRRDGAPIRVSRDRPPRADELAPRPTCSAQMEGVKAPRRARRSAVTLIFDSIRRPTAGATRLEVFLDECVGEVDEARAGDDSCARSAIRSC